MDIELFVSEADLFFEEDYADDTELTAEEIVCLERDLAHHFDPPKDQNDSSQALTSPPHQPIPIIVPPKKDLIAADSMFDSSSLCLKAALAGIAPRKARQQRFVLLLRWIRGTMIHFNKNSIHQEINYANLKLGPYINHYSTTCPVINCKNLRCKKTHHCLMCASIFNILCTDHQYGRKCHIFDTMSTLLTL